MEAELKFPKGLSNDAIDLMKKLLNRNPAIRIGSTNGFEEVKNHPWCKDIEWEKIA